MNNRQKKKPGEQYPELIAYFAEISLLAYRLYQLLKPEETGKQLGVKRQTMQYHIDKKKEATQK